MTLTTCQVVGYDLKEAKTCRTLQAKLQATLPSASTWWEPMPHVLAIVINLNQGNNHKLMKLKNARH